MKSIKNRNTYRKSFLLEELASSYLNRSKLKNLLSLAT